VFEVKFTSWVKMFNFMSKNDRFEIVKKMNASNEKKIYWNLTPEDIETNKSLIENSEFYNYLIRDSKISDVHCLINNTNKKNKYYKRHIILKSRGIKTELVDWYYKISSTYTHGSPASIDRARQKYINKDFIDHDSTKEILSVMQVASSFYCCTLIDIIDYYKLGKEPYLKEEIKLISEYKKVIINGH
jgi:hypothetical protein